ncbi:MAG: acyl-CoA dehydrogenase family protein, partial [Deltaproteobacteria bacterium]
MFELTKSQKQIQKAAKGFAKGEFDKDLAYEFEKSNTFPAKIWKQAAQLGFVGIHFPEKYAGGDMGMLEAVLILEEFCRKDASIGNALAVASFASECLLTFGSDALKEKFLPPVAEGEMVSAGAFSESPRGGNYTFIQTTAANEMDQWVINGTKTNVINGGSAGFYIVLCRTEPNTEGDKGISMLVVEGDRRGISSETVGKKLGGNMFPTAQVTFENVTVPGAYLVGKKGAGIAQLNTFLLESRLLSAAQALGIARGALDRAMDYIKERVQFQRKLAVFQVTQHKIADMATKIELAELITYKAAWKKDQGRLDPKLTSMAKMTAARTAM